MVVHMVWFYCHYRVMFLKEIWSWGIHLLSQFVCALQLSCVWLFATPWTVACQAPLSMESSRQEYWSGLPSPPPGGHQPRDWTQVFCIAGDPGLIPGLGRTLGDRSGYLLQYSCLEDSMDRGAWQATVHMITKSWALTSDYHLILFLTVASSCQSVRKQEKKHFFK